MLQKARQASTEHLQRLCNVTLYHLFILHRRVRWLFTSRWIGNFSMHFLLEGKSKAQAKKEL